jgi:hypothetical protein
VYSLSSNNVSILFITQILMHSLTASQESLATLIPPTLNATETIWKKNLEYKKKNNSLSAPIHVLIATYQTGHAIQPHRNTQNLLCYEWGALYYARENKFFKNAFHLFKKRIQRVLVGVVWIPLSALLVCSFLI